MNKVLLKIAEAAGVWPVIMEVTRLPDGLTEDDIAAPIANPIYTHYSVIWHCLHPHIQTPTDEELGRYGLGQVSEAPGTPTEYGAALGYPGPAIGIDGRGRPIFADYGTLTIVVPNVEQTEADDIAESAYREELRKLCERWPALIDEYAAMGGTAYHARIAEGWAEKMRYLDPALLGPQALAFIEHYPSARSASCCL